MTKINRILNNPEWSVELKILKLQSLALRAFPSSPAQQKVIAAYKALMSPKESDDMPNFESAFATFMQKAQIACDADYAQTGSNPFHGPKLSAMHGKRYIRIVSESPGSRAAWAFVDQTNGDVLKCDGWKAPAKGARGNIYDAANGCARVRWTSIK